MGYRPLRPLPLLVGHPAHVVPPAMASSPLNMDVAIELGHGTTTAVMYKSNLEVGRPAALVLAHGAGAGQRHPFMVQFAQALSERGIDVLTFDFLYMQQRRRIPDRMPQLVECWNAEGRWFARLDRV